MDPVIFHPNRNFQIKLYIQIALIFLLAVSVSGFLAVLIGTEENGAAGAMMGIFIIGTINLAWFAVAMLLVAPYYRSLQYEIHDDEVIVRVGVITKTVKHVPYRTVTNLTVNRGPFDRIFQMGTLKIQTAGMSGQTGAEEELVGLLNYQEIYEQVAAALRKFRGGMAPTAAEEELVAGSDMMGQLLVEVREIRKVLVSGTDKK